MRPELSLPALFRATPGDLLEKRHREEMSQPIDARVVGRPAVLLVELAESPVAIAAELIEASLVTGVVDRGCDAGCTLWGEKDVVVCRMLRRKLHDVSEHPFARRSLTR